MSAIRGVLFMVSGFAALIGTAMVAILGPTIVGPFMTVLGDGGGGIGTEASSAISFAPGITFVFLSTLVVPVAWFLFMNTAGRPERRRRRPPRRRP